eukprot:scaffold8887_cov107-Cylindrotheca_fusiformis.AAC.1
MRSAVGGEATRLVCFGRRASFAAYDGFSTRVFRGIPSNESNVTRPFCNSSPLSIPTAAQGNSHLSTNIKEWNQERRSRLSSIALPTDESSLDSSSVAVSVSENKMVTLRYGNLGESANFHAAWLWVNDPANCHPSSGQKLRSLSQFNKETNQIASAKIVNFQDEEDIDFPRSPPGSLHSRGGIYKTGSTTKTESKMRSMVQILWQSGDTSLFDLEWLLRFASSSSVEQNDDVTTTRVTKEVAIGASDNPDCVRIPKFDYRDVMREKDVGMTSTLFQVLDSIMVHGAVLIQNAPEPSGDSSKDESIVADLGRRICGSKLSHGSLYGDVFHVESMPEAHNIAYTTVALPPHQDLTYYESKPFLQLLHCVQTAPTVSEEGSGESVLIDAMAAVEHLRTVAPHLFQILCTVEATFCKQREGADMASGKPHIVTSSYDDSVVAVHWSPPFEGPLQLPPSLNAVEQERLMDDYVMAYQAMESLLDDKSPRSTSLPVALEQELHSYARNYTWEYALKEGEILVFNNQRMLHGRRSFTLKEGTSKHRHLIGCYTDAMDTLSHYRLLLRESLHRHDGRQLKFPTSGSPPRKNAGNGTRAIFVR